MSEKTAPVRGSSLLRLCKCGCGTEFKPKRVDQRFASPSCKTRYTMTAYEVGLKVIEGKGRFHFARLENSPQLQALHAAFLRRRGQMVTSLELYEETKLMSISTRVAELRANGIDISDAKYLGKSETGARVYGYKLNEQEV